MSTTQHSTTIRESPDPCRLAFPRGGSTLELPVLRAAVATAGHVIDGVRKINARGAEARLQIPVISVSLQSVKCIVPV